MKSGQRGQITDAMKDFFVARIGQSEIRRVPPASEDSRASLCSIRAVVEVSGLFLLGAQLGQQPVLIGDPDDGSGVDVFPIDGRRV